MGNAKFFMIDFFVLKNQSPKVFLHCAGFKSDW